MVVVWKAIKELNGNLYAQILGAVCVLFSCLLRLNTLFQPNSFDVLSWTAFYFVLIKYFKSHDSKWLFIGAIVFSLGLLNKYNIVFLLIGFLPAILLTEQRKVFLVKRFYFAILLVLILVAPNLIWQYNNNFPVVHHMKVLAQTQLVNVDRLEFLKSQFLFFIGASVVIISGVIALLLYKPFKPYRSFFWSIILTILVFMYFKAKDYYAIGVYPIYIAFGSVYLANKLSFGWKRFLQPILIAIPVLLFIPMYNLAFPNKDPEYIVRHAKTYSDLGMLRWEDGKEHLIPQDYADMLGWKELAEKIDSICEGLPNLDNTLILCDNYGQAGAINYYKKNKRIQAQSFDADYVNWLNYDQNISDVILVKEPDDEDSERKTEIPLFKEVCLSAKRINKYAREDTISIYVLKGAKVDVTKRIKMEADQKLNYK